MAGNLVDDLLGEFFHGCKDLISIARRINRTVSNSQKDGKKLGQKS